MPVDITLPLSFLAGVIAFLSPCILPVIPSYITIISGIGYQELATENYNRLKVFAGSLAFVLGFSLVFVVMGLIFSSTGILLGGLSKTINRIAGIIVILFGLNYIFDFIKLLNVEKRIHITKRRTGLFGSFLIGATFGAGWTPCIGPILSTVLIMAGTSGQSLRGSLFLMLFSLGLGLPFILTGLFFSRSQILMQKIKKKLGLIKKIGGVFLILIGVLIFDGALLTFNGTLFGWASSLNRWSIRAPNAAKIVAVIPVLILLFLISRSLLQKLRIRNVEVESDVVQTELIANSRSTTYRYIVIRVVVSILLLVGAVGIISGVIEPYKFISSWLTFTGI